MALIPKDENHHHYWIEYEVLYETYNTIRGLCYRELKDVEGMPDEEHCSEECLKYIQKQYYEN